MRKGHPAYDGVVERFGSTILGQDREIDRRKLGARVFADPGELAALNSLVHPVVRREWALWLEGQAGQGVAAVIVPLLYEIGDAANWDVVICVASPLRLQRERMSKRGLSNVDIDRRLASQMPVWKKMELADKVMFNSGTQECLKMQAILALRNVVEK